MLMVVKREKSMGGESIGKRCREKPERRDAACCVFSRIRSRLLCRLHFQRRLKPKAERRLGGKNNIFVAGKCGTSCTGATAGERANRGAFPPTGQAADDRTERCSSTCNHGCALAFAFFRTCDG